MQINAQSQWDFMQTRQEIETLSLCLWFFLHDLSDLSDLISVNQVEIFQFPLTIKHVPATLARLNG